MIGFILTISSTSTQAHYGCIINILITLDGISYHQHDCKAIIVAIVYIIILARHSDWPIIATDKIVSILTLWLLGFGWYDFYAVSLPLLLRMRQCAIRDTRMLQCLCRGFAPGTLACVVCVLECKNRIKSWLGVRTTQAIDPGINPGHKPKKPRTTLERFSIAGRHCRNVLLFFVRCIYRSFIINVCVSWKSMSVNRRNHSGHFRIDDKHSDT